MKIKKSIRFPGSAGGSRGTQSTAHTDQNANQASKQAASGMSFNFETDQPNQEAVCRRTTFFVNADWQVCSSLEAAKCVVGQMYVESIEPMITTQEYPIVLIHGDFHTGQLTKPDGNPGWASFFVNKGYRVYTLDLPPCGRSNFLTGNHLRYRDVANQAHSLAASFVERELTASEKQHGIGGEKVGWARALLHDKWPGTGQRGDEIFTKYCASLTTLTLKKVERETLAQNALRELLKVTGKVILIGEGSGSTMAWLAADAEPNLVVGVVAVEPTGPPFGVAFTRNPSGRNYTPFIQFDGSCRKYGLADIPLTYDPPVPITVDAADSDTSVLDVYMFERPDKRGCCLLQRPIGNTGNAANHDQVRQLIHLKKMPHVIITAHASSHTSYDWATLYFMKQAGVNVDWIKLEDHDILGNGHLMFLEINSDDVASVIDSWIKKQNHQSGPVANPKIGATVLSSKMTEPRSNTHTRITSSDGNLMHGNRTNSMREINPEEDLDESEETDSQSHDFAFEPSAPGQIAANHAVASSTKRANSEILPQKIKNGLEDNSWGQSWKRQQLERDVAEPGLQPSYNSSSFPAGAFHKGNSMLTNLDGLDPFVPQNWPSKNSGGVQIKNVREHHRPADERNAANMIQQSFQQPLQVPSWTTHNDVQAMQAFNFPNATTETNKISGDQMGYGTGHLTYSPTGTLRFESPPNNQTTGQFNTGQPVQGVAQVAFFPSAWMNGYSMAMQNTMAQASSGYHLQNLTGSAGVIQGQQLTDMAAQQLFQTAHNNEIHDIVGVSTPQHSEKAPYPSPESLEEPMLSGGSGATLGTLPIVAPSSPTPAPKGATRSDSMEAQMFSDFIVDPIEAFVKFE